MEGGAWRVAIDASVDFTLHMLDLFGSLSPQEVGAQYSKELLACHFRADRFVFRFLYFCLQMVMQR